MSNNHYHVYVVTNFYQCLMMPIPKEQGCTAIEFTNNIEFFAPVKYYLKMTKILVTMTKYSVTRQNILLLDQMLDNFSDENNYFY